MTNWPPLDLHAHIDTTVTPQDLLNLRAVVFAASRTLAESRLALHRQQHDLLTIWASASTQESRLRSTVTLRRSSISYSTKPHTSVKSVSTPGLRLAAPSNTRYSHLCFLSYRRSRALSRSIVTARPARSWTTLSEPR